ncbi:hypothetical protein SNE40_017528 [Patella caerulea]|uniref:Uncharacterized protein n=1 Tax=Patella caerulea TaxID=87958 RepID=A0AAN8PE94_PATCE
MGELLRWMVVLLSITSIALASLHGEEKEQDILALIDISLSLSFSSCDDINCDNGGSCFKGNCVCPDKTTGIYCEVLENPCEPNPCYANGNCSETEEGYICECPRDFFGTNCDVIQSPNYPDNYANNTDMTWVLSGIPDKYIQLQFDDVFQIEDSNCGVVDYSVPFGCKDYITITSGVDDDLDVEYCGGARPSPITAPKGSDVWIVFKSGSQCSYSGFKLNYGYIDTSIPTNPIASTNYPDNYNTSMYVTWLISGIPDKYILLQFEDVFEMEDNRVKSCGNVSYNSVFNDCRDYIQIITGDIYVTYCGGAPPSPITALEGSDVLIVFRADDSCSYRGFKLNYTHIGTIRHI